MPIYKAVQSNHHSLSSLNEHATTFLSVCYPVCYYKDNLLVKFHIGKRSDINPLYFAEFILKASDILSNSNQRSITGKYNINSAGDILLAVETALSVIDDNIFAVAFLFFLIFGGELTTSSISLKVPSIASAISAYRNRDYTKAKKPSLLKKRGPT